MNDQEIINNLIEVAQEAAEVLSQMYDEDGDQATGTLYRLETAVLNAQTNRENK